MTTSNYTTLSPLELAIIHGSPGFMTQTVLDTNTGKPYVYIRSDDKEWSGETMTIEQVDTLIATLQQARDNAAEYLDVIPFTPVHDESCTKIVVHKTCPRHVGK